MTVGQLHPAGRNKLAHMHSNPDQHVPQFQLRPIFPELKPQKKGEVILFNYEFDTCIIDESSLF